MKHANFGFIFMNKDNLISGLLGVIVGLIAAVVFTLRANNPQAPRASLNAAAAVSSSANDAVAFSDLSHTNKDEAGNVGGGGGMQPQVRVAIDAARDNPKDVRAQLNAAGMYYQIGQYDEALPFIERALAAEPDNIGALTAAADTRFEKGDFIGAGEFYERVLRQQPTNVNVRIDLGSTFYQRTPSEYDRAIAEYTRALETENNHPDALHNLAVVQLAKGNRIEADQIVQRLAAAHPDHPTLAELRENLSK